MRFPTTIPDSEGWVMKLYHDGSEWSSFPWRVAVYLDGVLVDDEMCWSRIGAIWWARWRKFTYGRWRRKVAKGKSRSGTYRL